MRVHTFYTAPQHPDSSFSLTSPAFAWENPCEKAKEEVKTLVEDIARSEEALKGVKAISEEATATVTAAVAEYADLMMKYEKFAHNLKAFTFQLDELKTKLASAEKKGDLAKTGVTVGALAGVAALATLGGAAALRRRNH